MKRIVQPEKKEASLAKQKERAAQQSVDEAMISPESEAISKLQRQFAQLFEQAEHRKGKLDTPKSSLKGKASKKAPSDGKKSSRQQQKSRQSNKPKPRLGAKGNENPKPNFRSSHGANPSASKKKASHRKQN